MQDGVHRLKALSHPRVVLPAVRTHCRRIRDRHVAGRTRQHLLLPYCWSASSLAVIRMTALSCMSRHCVRIFRTDSLAVQQSLTHRLSTSCTRRVQEGTRSPMARALALRTSCGPAWRKGRAPRGEGVIHAGPAPRERKVPWPPLDGGAGLVALRVNAGCPPTS